MSSTYKNGQVTSFHCYNTPSAMANRCEDRVSPPMQGSREGFDGAGYEQRLDVSEGMIHVAMGSLLLRRIAHP
jgi:hypothetical protein